MPAAIHHSESSWRISSLRKFENRTSLLPKPLVHTSRLSLISFALKERIKLWYNRRVNLLIIAGSLYQIRFYYVIQLFNLLCGICCQRSHRSEDEMTGAIHRLAVWNQCLFMASWLRWSHRHAGCVTWLAICQSLGKRHWHWVQLSWIISQSQLLSTWRNTAQINSFATGWDLPLKRCQ